jgi:NAD(P)H-nitrite reductase large subunit
LNHLIIGNGGAGLRAAQTIRSRDPEAKITMIDSEPYPCYYRMRLPDYISGWKDRNSIWVVKDDFYAEYKIDLMRSATVTAVNPDAHTVRLANGDSLSYDRLLIASGARVRKLKSPGYDLDGVVYLRTLDEAEDIIRRGKNAENAVALGGGLLGVEMARCFNEMHLNSYYLIREDRFWPQMLDLAASAIIERVLEEKGVILKKEDAIEEILGEGGKVTGVATTAGESLKADMVGIAIGVESRIDFLEGSGIETDRGIIIDDHMLTNKPDIYAAGDVAQAYNVATGKHEVLTSYLNTQRQGDAAGINMSGGDKALGGVVNLNVIIIYGIPVACVGLNLPPEGEGYEELTDGDPKGNEYRKLVLRDGVLVGGILVGKINEAQAMEQLIGMEADVSPYKDRLFDPGFNANALLTELSKVTS